MEVTDNQTTKTPRELIVERMSRRYPTRRFGGPDGPDGQDDIEQAILETLDDYDKYNEEMSTLFSTDPRSAEFIQEWVECKDPRLALVKTFGDDLINSLNDKESAKKFEEQLTEWRARKKADDDARAECDANWQKSLDALEKWGDEKGLSQEQKVAIIMRLIDVAANAIQNVYTPEDFEMAKNALNYTADVERAHEDGVVEGRNAKIEARRKAKDEVGKLPPAIGGSQGMRAKEPAPERPKSVWAGLV